MPREPVAEPFPIFRVGCRFLLYDANVVSHVRATHHMCGCLVGTLPQIPQQNVFLGLPLELMTEEAALLVEKGAGYVVDDVKAHMRGLANMMEADKKRYLQQRKEEGLKAVAAHHAYQSQRSAAARARKMKPLAETESNVPQDEDEQREGVPQEETRQEESLRQEETCRRQDTPREETVGLFAHTLIPSRNSAADFEQEETLQQRVVGQQEVVSQQEVVGLFAHTLIPSANSAADIEPPILATEPLKPEIAPSSPSSPSPAPSSRRPSVAKPVTASSLGAPGVSEPPGSLTPSSSPASMRIITIATTSTPPFHQPTPDTAVLPRPKDTAYALYKYMHAQHYFLSPGLRFGCQFMAYPGDPLRFHSHFVCNGLGWDEEIDVIDIVAGGRLGTGVKKAFLFGAEPEKREGEEQGEVRVFTVEWGGF